VATDVKRHGGFVDPTSATLAWGSLWENTILADLQPSISFFDGADPMIETEGLGESWMNIQEWADLSFQPELLDYVALQDIECETKAAGGIRFACYGMVSRRSSKLVKINYKSHPIDLRCFSQAGRQYARTSSQSGPFASLPVF